VIAYKAVCGGCGGQDFHVYMDNSHYFNVLKIECIQCKSVNVIQVDSPRMTNREWTGEGALVIDPDEGRLY